MKPDNDEPKAPEPKPALEPKDKDDLKSITMPELQIKLDSSPYGLLVQARKTVSVTYSYFDK